MRRLAGRLLLSLLVGAALLGPSSYLLLRAGRWLLDQPVYRFPAGTRLLVAGDSHAEAALDPAALGGAANVARSAENYFFTYYKLRHFLERNPGIRTVVLSLGWHNLAGGYNEAHLFGDRAGEAVDYFPLLDGDGRAVLRRWSPDYVVPFLAWDGGIPLGLYRNGFLLRGLLRRPPAREDVPFFGGFRDTSRSRVERDQVREKLASYYALTPGGGTSSPLMEGYLGRIAGLCEERRARLLLVNTPIHPLHRGGVPPWAVAGLDGVVRRLSGRPGVRYLDLSALPLPTSAFLDGDHVNRAGAAEVGKAVAAFLTAWEAEG